MGLGKTLTMISAIICSLTEAAAFKTATEDSIQVPLEARTATRATLVVVTSSRVFQLPNPLTDTALTIYCDHRSARGLAFRDQPACEGWSLVSPQLPWARTCQITSRARRL